MQRARGGIEIRHDRTGRHRQRNAQHDEEQRPACFDDAQTRRCTTGDRPEQPQADARKSNDGRKTGDDDGGDQRPMNTRTTSLPAPRDHGVQHRELRDETGERRHARDQQHAADEREPEKRHRRGNRDADFVVGRVRIGGSFAPKPDVSHFRQRRRSASSVARTRVRSVMPLTMKNAPVASTELAR